MRRLGRRVLDPRLAAQNAANLGHVTPWGTVTPRDTVTPWDTVTPRDTVTPWDTVGVWGEGREHSLGEFFSYWRAGSGEGGGSAGGEGSQQL